jgi:hypothetical protein
MNLLPLFLKDRATLELPIVNSDYKQIVIRELAYKNLRQEDLITECTIEVGGEKVIFKKINKSDKVYYIDGIKGNEMFIPLDENKYLTFKLVISCHDFQKCHCRDHRFQLNISGLGERVPEII